MAKDPAINWYFDNWGGGTKTMSRFLKGCYIDLLDAQFHSGHLSLEDIKNVLGADFSSWQTLQKKFITDVHGLFFNERLDREIQKRLENSKKQSEKIKKRWDLYRGTYHGINNSNSVVIPLDGIETGIETEFKTETEFKIQSEFKTKTEFVFENREKLFQERNQVWFTGQLNKILLDQLPPEKKMNLPRAIEEAYQHMAADPERLARASPADCHKLLNTWLANMSSSQNQKKQNGNSTKRNRKDEHTASLIAGIAERHGSDAF